VGVSNSTVLHKSFYNDSSGFWGISLYNSFCIGSLFEIGCRHTKTIRGIVLAWVILGVSKHLAWNIIIKYSRNDISFEQSGLLLGYPSATQRPNGQCWVSVWAVCGMVFTKMIWQCEEVFFILQKGIVFNRITDVCLRRTRWHLGRCRWWTWGSSGTGGHWWRPLPRQPRHLMWMMRGMG